MKRICPQLDPVAEEQPTSPENRRGHAPGHIGPPDSDFAANAPSGLKSQAPMPWRRLCPTRFHKPPSADSEPRTSWIGILDAIYGPRHFGTEDLRRFFYGFRANAPGNQIVDQQGEKHNSDETDHRLAQEFDVRRTHELSIGAQSGCVNGMRKTQKPTSRAGVVRARASGFNKLTRL
jgi:hypothetical protein